VNERDSDAEIARELNRANLPSHTGGPWSAGMIHTLLQNENYIGNLVHNRTSRRLGQSLVKNPADQWIRREAAIDPIVNRAQFARAQKIMAERRLEISEDEMLRRLRVLLHRKGELNSSLINGTLGVPCVATLTKHFGSLRKAYSLIGYSPKRDCAWFDARNHWADALSSLSTQVFDALKSSKRVKVEIDKRSSSITVNGDRRVCFQVVRHIKKKAPHHTATWRVRRKRGQQGFVVALRLNETNQAVEDYLVLPASKIAKAYLTVSEKTFPATAFKTVASLVAKIRADVSSKS
jgi:hypothetical protein